MKKQTDSRKRKKINEKRLAAYTAAAGAALLAAGPADAAIHYSGLVDVSLAASMTVKLRYEQAVASSSSASSFIDINGDGTNDLMFYNFPTSTHAWHCPTCVAGSWYLAGGFSNLNGVSFAGGAGLPSNLTAGSIIDVSNNWTNNNGKLFFGNMEVHKSTSYGTYFNRVYDRVNDGNFTRGNPGYIGIKFDPGDGTKYGWIHIASVESRFGGDRFRHGDATSTYTYKIDGWAYDDSGAPIAAGTTVVPEPTSMALFAAGAATIMAKRRMKKNKHSKKGGGI